MKNFIETLYDSYGQSFAVDEVLFQHKTEHQDLLIFKNAEYGHVMTLDGIVQTTERDEFFYHEMLTHVPLMSLENPKKVLVIGGGDGGILREVLKHPSVEQAVLVEIDAAVVEMCERYFPAHSAGAFHDSRVNIVIQDGKEFLAQCDEKFDVIITDSTDPIGPGEVLFTQTYYDLAKHCLTEQGILVTQNGVAFKQLDEAVSTSRAFKALYTDWGFYSVAVPTYVGGIMLLGFASNSKLTRQPDLEELNKRYQDRGLKTEYYNPRIHLASFSLPNYVQRALAD